MTFADVAEGVRATIAAYAQALDDGRTEDIVETFCADGSADIPGTGLIEGHDSLRAAYARWKPRRPQRHVIVNTLVTSWSDTDATVSSDVLFMLKGDAGWSTQMVGRYADVFHCVDGAWLIHRRVATFID
jgi:hypothetical protein